MNPKGQSTRKGNRNFVRNHGRQMEVAQHFQVLKENSMYNSIQNQNILRKKGNQRYSTIKKN